MGPHGHMGRVHDQPINKIVDTAHMTMGAHTANYILNFDEGRTVGLVKGLKMHHKTGQNTVFHKG